MASTLNPKQRGGRRFGWLLFWPIAIHRRTRFPRQGGSAETPSRLTRVYDRMWSRAAQSTRFRFRKTLATRRLCSAGGLSGVCWSGRSPRSSDVRKGLIFARGFPSPRRLEEVARLRAEAAQVERWMHLEASRVRSVQALRRAHMDGEKVRVEREKLQKKQQVREQAEALGRCGKRDAAVDLMFSSQAEMVRAKAMCGRRTKMFISQLNHVHLLVKTKCERRYDFWDGMARQPRIVHRQN